MVLVIVVSEGAGGAEDVSGAQRALRMLVLNGVGASGVLVASGAQRVLKMWCPGC